MAFAKVTSSGTSNVLLRFPARVPLFVALLLFAALGIGCGEARPQDTRNLSNPSSVLPQASSPYGTLPGPSSTVAFMSSQTRVSTDAGAADGAERRGEADKIPRLTVLGIPQFLDVAVVGVIDATTIRVETEDRLRDDIGMLGLQPPDVLNIEASGEYPIGQHSACLRHWDRRAREFAETRLQGRSRYPAAPRFHPGRVVFCRPPSAVVMLGDEDFNATMLGVGAGPNIPRGRRRQVARILVPTIAGPIPQ